MTPKARNDFSASLIDAIGRRASFICSKPDCRSLTLAPSKADPSKFIYVGNVAHITAAAARGPRYDTTLSPEQRSGPDNALFLCSSCADMIDKNGGADFSVEVLREWKARHEQWVGEQLNKSSSSIITTVAGQHQAQGKGTITALDIRGPATILPGTIATAKGEGTVTGTRIGGPDEETE